MVDFAALARDSRARKTPGERARSDAFFVDAELREADCVLIPARFSREFNGVKVPLDPSLTDRRNLDHVRVEVERDRATTVDDAGHQRPALKEVVHFRGSVTGYESFERHPSMMDGWAQREDWMISGGGDRYDGCTIRTQDLVSALSALDARDVARMAGSTPINVLVSHDHLGDGMVSSATSLYSMRANVVPGHKPFGSDEIADVVTFRSAPGDPAPVRVMPLLLTREVRGRLEHAASEGAHCDLVTDGTNVSVQVDAGEILALAHKARRIEVAPIRIESANWRETTPGDARLLAAIASNVDRKTGLVGLWVTHSEVHAREGVGTAGRVLAAVTPHVTQPVYDKSGTTWVPTGERKSGREGLDYLRGGFGVRASGMRRLQIDGRALLAAAPAMDASLKADLIQTFSANRDRELAHQRERRVSDRAHDRPEGRDR